MNAFCIFLFNLFRLFGNFILVSIFYCSQLCVEPKVMAETEREALAYLTVWSRVFASCAEA